MYTTLPSPFRRHALAAALLGACLQVAAQTANFDIPPQPLTDALQQFARQAGVQLVFVPDVGAGRTNRAVSGTHDARAALRQLLQGTGLEMRVDGATWTVARAAQGTATLGEVRVTAQADHSATTEGTGSYAARGTTLFKGTQSLKDIPQSITVVTRQQMDDQRLDTVTDVLAQTPGIYFSRRPNGGSDIFTRGFKTDTLQYDGVPLQRFHSFGNDFSASAVYLDRIEVQRGAQGLLEGAGSPAGSVNLVRKRGLAQRALTIEARAGSWDTYGTRIDAGGPLNASGTLRGRAVIDHEDRKSFLDTVWDRNTNAYMALDLDVTPDTTVGLGVARSRLNGSSSIYEGQPRYTDGTALALPRSAFFGADWNSAQRKETQMFLDVEHRFDADWTLKAAAIYSRDSFDSNTTYEWGLVPLGGRSIAGDLFAYDNSAKNSGVDVHLSGKFNAWGMAHDIVAGANYSRIRRDDLYHYQYGYTSYDVFAPDHQVARFSTTGMNYFHQQYDISQKGGYGLWRSHVTDRLTVVLGGRLSWYDYQGHSRTHNTNSTPGAPMKESAEFTPYGGLVYALTPQWSAYASYAEIFNPQGVKDAAQQVLPPMTGVSYEAGVKGELFDKALNASLAVYRTDQKNRAVTDYDAGRICDGAYCSRAAGKVRSEGLEAEAHGQLARGLQVSGGYTYARNKYLEDSDASLVGTPFEYLSPRHMLRLWSDYQLPGELSPWSLGAGISYQSERRTSSKTRLNPVQGGYSVWNARVGYKINAHWSAALNISNLFDKHYHSFITENYVANYVGEPRRVLLTLRGSF